MKALREWTAAAGLGDGRVFRSVTRHGRIGETLRPASVADVVKHCAKAAGLNSAEFGATACVPVMMSRDAPRLLADHALSDDVEDLAVDQYPVLRRFRRSAVSGTQPQRGLYELHTELSQVVRTIRKLGREGRVEEAKALHAEHPDLEKQFGAVQGRYEAPHERRPPERTMQGCSICCSDSYGRTVVEVHGRQAAGAARFV